MKKSHGQTLNRVWSNTAKGVGTKETTMVRSPIAPNTSVGTKGKPSSLASETDPQAVPSIASWILTLFEDGADAVHLFSDTDEVTLNYTIEGKQIPVSIGARHFLIVEIPDRVMTSPGYRVYTR